MTEWSSPALDGVSLLSLKALMISCFGQNVLNESSISSNDERNVTSSRPWEAATVHMTHS